MKVPVPVLLVVLLLSMVGEVEVLQQTPRAVTVEPPSAVTLPPPVAVVLAIAEIAFVVTVGFAFTVTVTATRVALGHPDELLVVTACVCSKNAVAILCAEVLLI